MPGSTSPLVEGYLRNGALAITAAETLYRSENPEMYIPTAGHIGRAVENYLKAYIEYLGGATGHSHNLGHLVGEIRSYPENALGKIGSRPELRELTAFVTGSSYAFTVSNLPTLTFEDVNRFLKFAYELRAVITQAVTA